MADENQSAGPMSAENVPSSFDSSPEFFDEARFQKLWRKLKQEPLIPVGCAATCYALYQASKSIRMGDSTRTNKMFRARIYAQGFTLVAIVAGSMFYQDERFKRKKYEKGVEEQKAIEKRDKWLRELEARDNEERKWRENVERMSREAHEVAMDAKEKLQREGNKIKENIEGKFSSKSVREQVDEQGWGPGMWMSRTQAAWKRI